VQVCLDRKVEILDEVMSRLCPTLTASPSTTIVHIRLGDSLCANSQHVTDSLQPPDPMEVAQVIESSRHAMVQCLIFYATHGGCSNQTHSYVEALDSAISDRSGAQERHQNSTAGCHTEFGIGWHDADRHLCQMASAGVFVQGAGGYSYLAERVRARRGLPTIQALVKTPMTWLGSPNNHAGD
jgi:hypothetical protein